MPRRGEINKRKLIPDPKYKSQLVAKFINCIMKSGKKSIAESIMYDAFDLVENKLKEPPLEAFERAMENVKPVIEVKSRRVGGSTYQVPTEVRPNRRVALAIQWIIESARKRSEKSISTKLAGEIMDASSQKGAAVKKREDTHKMAEANKAFAHYHW